MPSDVTQTTPHRIITSQLDEANGVSSKRATRIPTSRAELRALAESTSNRNTHRRQSIFKEVDVDGVLDGKRQSTQFASGSSRDIIEEDYFTLGNRQPSQKTQTKLHIIGSMGTLNSPYGLSTVTRLSLLAFIMVIITPLMYDMPMLGSAGPSMFGAKAGVIQRAEINDLPSRTRPHLAAREDTNPVVCKRWSQQSALVNGTIFLYGGHASTEPDQTNGTWVNDFLSLDVTSNFDIDNAPLKGLPRPSGLPAVSNGYLWQSYDTLYLYGGEVSWGPRDYPDPYSLWAYDIKNAKWNEHSDPKTSSGNNSDPTGQPVQQAGEGAGVSIPELGRGYYLAGHLDSYTTAGWDLSVPRVYLKSLLEYTFPGYTNDGVESLRGGKLAGEDGVWRNVTKGGIQDTAVFMNRADSALVYVPGFGEDGILVNVGGGSEFSFSPMNVIDVYDIANSTWYKQATSGPPPGLRVNPCTVAASAADGSSTNIYMYGGQDLKDNQTQYDDMWILTIPSFTWIEVDTTGQSVPPARVGHTCNMFDSQIISIGGYNSLGKKLGCEPGIYVFNTVNLTWSNTFVALNGGDVNSNPQNQQISQQKSPMGLSGSFGYQVPLAIQSIVGGDATGGATITSPARTASAGPMATGKPITYTIQGTYTITQADGSVVTETGTTSSTIKPQEAHRGPNIAAIVAGVVAGVFFVLACYLGFCAWVYRRQLALYKNHVAMTQRNAINGGGNEKLAFLSEQTSKDRSTEQSSTAAATSGKSSGNGSSIPPVPPLGGEGSFPHGANSTANSSTEDLMRGQEPTFVGVLLNPRRSLRVINRD